MKEGNKHSRGHMQPVWASSCVIITGMECCWFETECIYKLDGYSMLCILHI